MSSTSTPRFTAEVFVIPTDGAYLVYAPLRRVAFVGNAATVNLIAALRSGHETPRSADAEKLIALLRYFQIVDGEPETPPVTTYCGNPKPTHCTLFLTTGCNLRCTYCYAAAGDTPLRKMPISVAQRGIDFIVANAIELGQPGIELAYHGGGEPSLNWDTLTNSYEYAAGVTTAKSLTLKAAMATNAVLSDEKIDWIISHLDGVSVSVDGLPEVHDKHRVTVGGNGSSAAVFRTLRRFDSEGFNYGLRLTVTAEHIGILADSIQYICRQFHPAKIQVEPAYQMGRWRDAPSAETEAFLAGFREARAVAAQYGHDLYFSGARLELLTNHFCGMSQDSFCLTADGSVSSCYEIFLESNRWADKFIYGHSNDAGTFEFQLPILNNLRQQTVDKREYCSGCFAKWSCGGDCYHKALDATGSDDFQGTERCHLIRELTKDQILQQIAESGGLYWNGSGSADSCTYKPVEYDHVDA